MALLCALMLLFAPGAMATTFSVGAFAACTHDNLRQALEAARADTYGPHLIKLATYRDDSLGYSTSVRYTLANPAADITIEGGYALCNDSDPVPGGRAVVEYTDAPIDQRFPLLTVSNLYTNPRRTLTLLRIDMTGDGSVGTNTIAPHGGGILVEKNITLRLGFGTTIRDFMADEGGGGVALLGVLHFEDPPPTSQYPSLYVTDGATIKENRSFGYGGGILAYYANVTLAGSHIDYNHATIGGGGIYAQAELDTPDNTEIRIVQAPEGNRIRENGAGMWEPFVTNSGFGGGILSRAADIVTDWGPRPVAAFTENTANYGGAIYIEGPNQDWGGPFTTADIRDSLFADNVAYGQGGALYSLNAVDWDFNSSGSAPGPGNRTGPNMLFHNNQAQDAAATDFGGAVAFITNERSDGMSRGIIHFYRSWFLDNEDAGGNAAVAATTAASEVAFRRSIFDGNSAGGELPALVASTAVKDIRFTYNTVVQNATAYIFMLPIGAGSPTINVQGSILWSPGTAFGFLGTATVSSGSCLVATTDSGELSGAWVADPELDNHYAPRGNSPAIDHCDSYGFEPGPDSRWHSNHDTHGVSPRFTSVPSFNWDLGAVEQVDVIHANSFGYRPGN